MMAKKPRLIIIGCGFGGLSLGKALAGKPLEVTIVDKNNYHAFLPLLYQVATGGLEPSNIAYPIRRIFRNKKNVRFKMADVIEVLPEEKLIKTSIGDMRYDYLVIATGSTNNFFKFENGSQDFLSLKTVEEALSIRNTLMRNLEKLNTVSDDVVKQELMNVSIVGAGPAGVEIAGALAEMKKKVLPKDFPDFDFNRMQIFLFEGESRVLSAMSQESSDASLKYLKELGVNVVLDAMVSDYDERKVYLKDGREFPSRTIIWTAGVKGAPIRGIGAEKLVGPNRIKVNRYNQIEGLNNVFAIGDVASISKEDTPHGDPMLAQVAMQQAKTVASNLLKVVTGRADLEPFQYNNKGVMATVGRNKAVVDLPKFSFQGALAWFVWMFIHLMALVGFRSKLITFINWTQNYFSYDRPLGAIIQKYRKT